MIEYKTVTEKAAEWDISPRHLQYLCKRGKVDGIVKRAGVWFIPDDALIPLKYSKSGAGVFRFVGTKKQIFNTAAEMFKLKGFEAVSIKDISDAVGITQSSMYNHFKSKHELLDTIYDFYCYYFHKDLPSLDDIEPTLRNGSLVDILKSTTFTYREDYAKQMSDISSIIFYRCSIDERAKEIMQYLMIDRGISASKAVFDRAVEIGRLAPLDTYAAAVFVNTTKLYALHIWMADPSPETSKKVREDETRLYGHAAKLLTDLKPPHKKA